MISAIARGFSFSHMGKELAFVKAGIDTDAGVGKLLFQSYQGTPDKEAVLAAAAEYGITPGAKEQAEPAADPGPSYDADERSQTRERAQLAAGSEVPAGEPNPDPIAAGYAEFHELRTTGVPLEDAQDAVVGRILEAAYAHKDPRVLHNQAQYLADNRGSARPG